MLQLDFSREALKNVGGEALARQIFQKKRSLHVVNEHFFGKFNDARASEVIFQSFPSLWATLVLCYIYADYFELYVPGKLTDMLANNIGPLGPVTQAKLIGTSILLGIPTLMIFLSLTLPAKLSRWINVIFGVTYTLVAIATISDLALGFFTNLFALWK